MSPPKAIGGFLLEAWETMMEDEDPCVKIFILEAEKLHLGVSKLG